MREQSKLPELIPPSAPHNPSTVVYYAPAPQLPEFEPDTRALNLSHYLWVLNQSRWKIGLFVVVCALATLAYTLLSKPIYEATATVDVDREAPSEVLGPDSVQSAAPLDSDQFLATQVKLIQSDAVTRPVAEQFNLLDVEGQTSGRSPEKAREVAGAPIALKELTVTRPANSYLLQISYRNSNPALAANVANAIANAYIAETYNIRVRSSASLSAFMVKQLDELKAKLEQSDLALAQSEKDLDVINPEDKGGVLSARLLQLNGEYTSAQADRVRKEAAWNSLKTDSLEAAQISSQGEGLAKLTEQLYASRQRFAEVKATYGSNHPEYLKAASELAEIQKQFEETRDNIRHRVRAQYSESVNREQMLQKAVAQTKSEWDALNLRSLDYQRAKQEAETDKALYDELIKKIHEANLNAGFRDSNIRIADFARPASEPVLPKKMLSITVAILLSFIFAVTMALYKDAHDTTLLNPDEASRFLGIDVIGALPIDRVAALRTASPEVETTGMIFSLADGLGKKKSKKEKGPAGGFSAFDETIRMIRNKISLSDFNHSLRSIVVTSAGSQEGKSTMAVHLAIANAGLGKRTLLVDGDLRRPNLHTKMGLSQREGLSNVLRGELPWHDATMPVDGRPNLSFMQAGLGSVGAADLIGPRLSILLGEFAKEYDLVIVDSPPLLGFAEGLQMVAATDGVLIVTRAGETTREEASAVVSTLQRIRANVIGIVMNQVSKETAAVGYLYNYGGQEKCDKSA